MMRSATHTTVLVLYATGVMYQAGATTLKTFSIDNDSVVGLSTM